MDKVRIRELADRVYRDVAGAMAVGLAYVGVETGLFHTLAGRGPMSLDAVVAHSGLQARYVEEWLKGMVAAGYVDYVPADETYTLAEEAAFLLSSEGTDHFMGGMFGMVPPLLAMAPRIVNAFRVGGGIPFADFAPECRHAIDLMNRGNYEVRLVDYWLAQLPDTVRRLNAGGRILDVGCGLGQAALVLAKAFPVATCVGVDPSAESISAARAAAAAAGSQAEFVLGTLDALPSADRFDLICLFDVLHDLPDPGAVLRQVRTRLTPDGVLFVVEPRVSDHLEENVNPINAMFYGFSVFHCMTQSLAQGGAALGACLGPTRTEALFREAGFDRVECLPIKSPTNLFYAVRA